MIDVAVIGGGPAGVGAAVASARAGLNVVMFERSAVGSEPLGPEESVGPDCIALLQNLGVTRSVPGTPFAGVMVGRDVAMFGTGTVRFAGLHLPRGRLDAALRQVAAKEGAILCSGVEVRGLELERAFRLRTSAGMVVAHTIIDASGRRAWLAHQLALGRRRLSPPLIALRDMVSTSLTRTGAFARFVPRPDGWIWLAETEADRVVRVRLAVAGRTASKLPVGATAHSATWYVVRRLAGPGWFIAGDAAAVLDPASGSGIATALRSGLAAGAAAAQTIAGNAHAGLVAARYHDALSREAEWGARTLTASYRALGVSLTTGDGASRDRRSASTQAAF